MERASAADVLQFALEKKLLLQPADKDLVVMVHEIEYLLNHKTNKIRSVLSLTGADSIHTAMAKTVGLPLGIAAKLILQGKIRLTGVHIPILKEIYMPVLAALSEKGIHFTETEH
jgi:saccharopine dehydrogenase-like NADP-dependent oxidoreductase